MIHKIPYEQINIFSDLIQDYLKNDPFFKDLITDFPDESALLETAKKRSFETEKRQVLHDVIEGQYKNAQLTAPSCLKSILDENTLTITTGHQLNLFTGPLYSIFKICSTINLCKSLNTNSENNFLPIFWMATEDHDLEEINHTYCYNNQIVWDTHQTGAVGRMKTEGIQTCIEQLQEILGDRGQAFIEILKEAYSMDNLALAHRRLVSELFKGSDLVILDADDRELKTQFASIMKDEILNNTSRNQIEKTNALLNDQYKVQAHAREINLFYLREGGRSRIVEHENGFGTYDRKNTWKKSELIEHLEGFPENFSPNVLMRPIYQECILPNVAYIGGGGELAYWVQLKNNFDFYKIPFPILILRNSMGIITEKESRKISQLGLEFPQLFLSEHELTSLVVSEEAEDIEFDGELDSIKMVYKEILGKAIGIDKSLEGSVLAELKKAEKSIAQISGKVLKAQKRQHETVINQSLKLRAKLFPDGKLQERYLNVAQFYDSDLISSFIACANPLDLYFQITEV